MEPEVTLFLAILIENCPVSLAAPKAKFPSVPGVVRFSVFDRVFAKKTIEGVYPREVVSQFPVEVGPCSVMRSTAVMSLPPNAIPWTV